MKTCPVCGGKLFEDMDVCYGCLHSFLDEASKDGSNRNPRGSRDASCCNPLDSEDMDSCDSQVAKPSSDAKQVASLPLSEGLRLVISVEPTEGS